MEEQEEELLLEAFPGGVLSGICGHAVSRQAELAPRS